MEIKELFEDEDAVSPVIGVILMVAITVILAAVIGTFVLGLGDQVQNNAPSANFQYSFTDPSGDGYNGASEDTVEIVHNGGDTIDADDITVSGNGANDLTGDSAFSGDISTGSSANYDNVNSGETIQIIWNNPNGQSSQIISSSEAP